MIGDLVQCIHLLKINTTLAINDIITSDLSLYFDQTERCASIPTRSEQEEINSYINGGLVV